MWLAICEGKLPIVILWQKVQVTPSSVGRKWDMIGSDIEWKLDKWQMAWKALTILFIKAKCFLVNFIPFYWWKKSDKKRFPNICLLNLCKKICKGSQAVLHKLLKPAMHFVTSLTEELLMVQWLFTSIDRLTEDLPLGPKSESAPPRISSSSNSRAGEPIILQ